MNVAAILASYYATKAAKIAPKLQINARAYQLAIEEFEVPVEGQSRLFVARLDRYE